MQKIKLFLILRDMWTTGGAGVQTAMVITGAVLLLALVVLGYGAGVIEFLGG